MMSEKEVALIASARHLNLLVGSDWQDLVFFARAVEAATYERAAKECDAVRDHILSKQSNKEGDPVDTNLRLAAYLGAEKCSENIRALKAQQGGGNA